MGEDSHHGISIHAVPTAFAGVLTSYFLSGIIVLEKDPVDSGLINAPKKHDTGRNSDGKHDGKVDKLEFVGACNEPNRINSQERYFTNI